MVETNEKKVADSVPGPFAISDAVCFVSCAAGIVRLALGVQVVKPYPLVGGSA